MDDSYPSDRHAFARQEPPTSLGLFTINRVNVLRLDVHQRTIDRLNKIMPHIGQDAAQG